MKNVITKKPADKFQIKKVKAPKSGKKMLGKAMKKLAKNK